MNNVRFEWISLNRVNRVKYGLTEYVENLILDGELLGIHVEYCKTKFNFFNIYNPLQLTLNKNVLKDLINLEDKHILAGDLNACAKSLGCKRNNDSGLVLEELLVEEEITLCNDLS